MTLALIVTCAILVEALTEYLGKLLPEKIRQPVPTQLVAVFIGIVVCTAAGADIFPLLGIPLSVPFLGAALTGILVSRGANFVHDLFKSFDKSQGK